MPCRKALAFLLQAKSSPRRSFRRWAGVRSLVLSFRLFGVSLFDSTRVRSPCSSSSPSFHLTGFRRGCPRRRCRSGVQLWLWLWLWTGYPTLRTGVRDTLTGTLDQQVSFPLSKTSHDVNDDFVSRPRSAERRFQHLDVNVSFCQFSDVVFVEALRRRGAGVADEY